MISSISNSHMLLPHIFSGQNVLIDLVTVKFRSKNKENPILEKKICHVSTKKTIWGPSSIKLLPRDPQRAPYFQFHPKWQLFLWKLICRNTKMLVAIKHIKTMKKQSPLSPQISSYQDTMSEFSCNQVSRQLQKIKFIVLKYIHF